MDLPSRSIRLEAYGLNIVLLYLHSAEELHPAAKSCRKGNLQVLETENIITSSCSFLQYLLRPRRKRASYFSFGYGAADY